MEVRDFSPDQEPAWEALCASAPNAVFLHTRRFLSYHGDRFQDRSILFSREGRVEGLLPAAADPGDPSAVVSHPGATYGGVVHTGRLIGSRMREALEAARAHYARQGFRRLRYKALPYIYARRPSQDDLYALFQMNARRVRCNLSCCVDLADRGRVSDRRRRGLNKARRSVTLSSDPKLLGALWEVLSENLARRHRAQPVHSKEELLRLQGLFPDEIQCRAALRDGRVEAGVVLFNSPRVWHAQYIASSLRGQEVCALDLVFEEVIAEAGRAGARYFDFGTSNAPEGGALNDGLYRFKSEFGASGVAYETYELDLMA